MPEKLHFEPKLETSLSAETCNQPQFTFCGCYGDINPIWRENGLSQCFYFSIASALLFLASIFVLFQIRKTKINGILVDSMYRSTTWWGIFQWMFILVLAVEVPTYFGVIWGSVYHSTSGVSILYSIVRLSSLIFTSWNLLVEGKMILLTTGIKGHSTAFISSLTLYFLIEIIPIISWTSTEWWFVDLAKKQRSKQLFGFWVVRLSCSSLALLTALCCHSVPKLNRWLHPDEDMGADVEAGVKFGGKFGESSDRSSTWAGAKKKLVLLWPYMWPTGNFMLQVRVIFCIAILVVGRVVNPYVPIFYKNIVNSLTSGASWGVVIWQVVAYVALRLLQGSGLSGGLLNGLRAFLWIRVQQYTSRLVQIRLFGHLHSLSLRWHLSRKTGEVLRSIDRGTNSINTLLSYICFNILPTICDVIIAIVYFASAFNAWFGLIVFVCVVLYLGLTIWITEWRTRFRRDMNVKDNKAKQRAIDSLLNFETVKYYNAERHEVDQFDLAIKDYQTSEYKTNASLVVLNLAQVVVINLGLLAGSLLCARFVLDGKFEIGDFVLFGTYMMQLYTPLGFFGTYYRMIQTSFIDMENMFDLFKESQEINDSAEAVELSVTGGAVEFDGVCFHYAPEKEILKNVSFRVGPGQTFALVGPSGSGKSTIIRLLFRFYDVQSGAIRIDGRDISEVTQESLRAAIGVVPQDTVLFNNDIINNIRYGRRTATDSEVVEAAGSADIHGRIRAMPDGYRTMVGERGLKLSGGEKQRVAIARTLLKAPEIVLLDEATSALDTTTERNIQASLARVCSGRTSIVVAHRLSTVVAADCILVLKEGEIVERGSHDDLVSLGGVYAEMWQQQLTENFEDKANDKQE